jgi:AcrR family transcriptional regulator
MLATNIDLVSTLTASPGKRERTRQRILAAAFALFEERGYDDTTTAQIAAAAGVSEMTLFRHFPSKDRLIGDDPYDPVIADSVARQPQSVPPIARAIAGVREAWTAVPEPGAEEVRRRLRIAVASPTLLRAMRANTRATEDAVAHALRSTGADPAEARIASAALLAALMESLLAWAASEDGSLDAAVRRAMDVLDGGAP